MECARPPAVAVREKPPRLVRGRRCSRRVDQTGRRRGRGRISSRSIGSRVPRLRALSDECDRGGTAQSCDAPCTMFVQSDGARYSALREAARMADPSFAKDIKPLFRDKDRSSMLGRFDLWSHQDVRDNAPAILEVLQAGTMPCDGKWNAQDIDLLERWIGGGRAE